MKTFLYLSGFSVFLLIAGMSGCKKDDPVPVQQYVKGTLYDKYSGKPLANTKVYLCKARWQGTKIIDDYIIMDEYLTDNTGRFNFNYSKQVTDLVGIYAKIEDTYYDYRTVKTIADYNRDSCDYNLKPKSWQVYHIKNTNPYDDSDVIYFDNKYLLTGSQVDTTMILDNHYDIILPTVWSITKNGQTDNFYGTPECIPYDTTYYTIFY